MRPRATSPCLITCLVSSLAFGPAACTAPPGASQDGDPTGPHLTSCQPGGLRKDLDILFVIDNSPGMATKQRAFVAGLPAFVRALDERDVNYHIGIVTTDVGANPTASSGFPGGRTIAGCASFAGDDGQLQNLPCSARGLSSAALAACTQLCPDPRAVPVDGRRYISRVDSVLNVPSKKDAQGREIGAEEALKCMALVGDTGCRIEAPLEAAKRALDGHVTENTGFLRSNSVLAVFFVTDEDDCSVQVGRRSELDPQVQDCTADTSPDAPASCFGLELRCLARGVECFDGGGGYLPMTRAGTKTSCRPRTSSFLVPLENYFRFFSVLRPSDKLILGGIVVLTIVMHLLLKHTWFGRAVRAVTQDAVGAQICGVRSVHMKALTFAFGSATVAVAAVLYVLSFPVDPYMGFGLTVKAFTIIVVGGVGNLPGALLAGVFLGVAEGPVGFSKLQVIKRLRPNLAEDPENTFWQVARERGLEEKMRAHGGNFAIQGELIGPGVQGNRYKLPKVEVMASPRAPVGAPPAFGPMMFQNSVWLK